MKATSFWLPIAVPALVTRSPIVHGTGAPRPLMGAYSAPIPPSLIGCVTVNAHDRLPVRDLGGHVHRQAVGFGHGRPRRHPDRSRLPRQWRKNILEGSRV